MSSHGEHKKSTPVRGRFSDFRLFRWPYSTDTATILVAAAMRVAFATDYLPFGVATLDS